MAKPTTSGFTISGLLDRSASTRNDYPVERIPIEEIADHPANAAYSMDEAGIAQLAKSIEEEGLTDLPLVRKLDDGGWQMVSGHRRKAAYALLAKEDEKYAQIPCRVIRGITDEQSVMLLHAANYFVRSLTVTERAAASRALGVEVERMRAENPELSGVRTEDIKAAIISEQTGRKVSGKTIQRQESLAQDRGEAHAPVARGRARGRALGGRRGDPRRSGFRCAGPAPCGMAGAALGQEGDDRVPQEVDRRARRRRRREGPRAQARGGARKRPSRAQALRVEGGKPAERAGQAGAREDLENGQQAPWTHLVPCRRPKGLLHRFQQVAYLVYTR